MGRRQAKKRSASAGRPPTSLAGVRVIGGRLRGRDLSFGGQPNTRPMKDRTREAIFNLLGPTVRGRQVFDLFAGTGALAIEAISRGAESAVLLERHFPTASRLTRGARSLGIESAVEVVAGDTFHWCRHVLDPAAYPPERPWLIFCSPPYDLYVERTDDMLGLIDTMACRATDGSLLVVESDERFSTSQLSSSASWDIRAYPPAIVSVGEVAGGCGQRE